MTKFTEKELEIMKYLCLENKEIGAIFYITPKTVQTHIVNIRQKVGVKSRASMVVELIKARILNIDDVVTN